MDEETPHTTRTQTLSISDLMSSLNTKSPGAATDGTNVGECLLDVLCVKYSGQELNRVSYRGMHTTTKVDKKWLPVTARVIPGVALPLLVGMNFRYGHAECPDMQSLETG